MRNLPRVLGVAILLATHSAFAADPPPQTPPAAPAAPAAPPAQAPPPPPSAEALADAARQSDLAQKAQKGKRYGQAAHLFEAAGALGRQPGAFHSAGLAWELADRPERAADAFARALTAGEGLTANETQQAKDHLDALERSLGTLDVKAPAGWTVQLDGGAEAPAPARLHGVAGVHSLAAVAPDRPITRRDVRLEIGKATPLTLKDEPSSVATKSSEPGRTEPTPATPSTAPAQQPRVVTVEAPESGQARRAVGFTALGLGVAALGASLVLGLETIDARNAYNSSPSRPLYDHEQTLQTWTNVALIGGAVLAVGGIVLVVWPSGGGEGRVGLAPSPGGGSVVGTF